MSCPFETGFILLLTQFLTPWLVSRACSMNPHLLVFLTLFSVQSLGRGGLKDGWEGVNRLRGHRPLLGQRHQETNAKLKAQSDLKGTTSRFFIYWACVHLDHIFLAILAKNIGSFGAPKNLFSRNRHGKISQKMIISHLNKNMDLGKVILVIYLKGDFFWKP